MLLVFASLSVFSLPFAVQKWQQTAFAQTMPFADGHFPGHHGYRCAARWETSGRERTYEDGTADNGAMLIQRYIPGDGPALVVVPQATEILLKTGRVNLLPISNPDMETLVISAALAAGSPPLSTRCRTGQSF